MSDVVIRPIERIKKKCLCCGNEMELFVYENKDFCDRCFYIICREVFNKENDRMTVGEVKEKIRRTLIRRNRGLKNDIEGFGRFHLLEKTLPESSGMGRVKNTLFFVSILMEQTKLQKKFQLISTLEKATENGKNLL